MTIDWDEEAITAVSRFLDDPAGLAVALDAIGRLAEDPDPAEAVRWGHTPWRRLRAGRYRILYAVEGDLITIRRVDRVAAG